VLVIVPDSQLSLAIGKRGQNARLAAKLTGLRVDIKSEGEVEEEKRREEEERIQGRAALLKFPGVGPQLVDKLIEGGFFSPARIVRAGLAPLQGLPGVGERKAMSLLESAQAWMAEHGAALAARESAAAAGEAAPEGHDVPEGEEAGGSREASLPGASSSPAE
jgi:N utilization substance protein A